MALRFPSFLIATILILSIFSYIPQDNLQVYAVSDTINKELDFASTGKASNISGPIEIDLGDQLTDEIRENPHTMIDGI